ncbi:MAG: NAD(P)/FAD-dependent oxidoreductase, partial [Clostridia bacterium]|nr:NAD(P)/FAD-dependent oxidoreductase [Clostridia bacterium]
MENNYDVLVIGAGTAGSFFAKRLAEQGLSVLVADKASEENLGKRLDIFHIDKDFFAKFGVPEPKEGDEDYVSLFEYGYARSAFDRYEKRTDYPFVVMKLPLFLKRLKKWATAAGVEYAFNCEFKEFLFDNGKIAGAKLDCDGVTHDVKAKLVADCSGIGSPVRRALPDGYGVETFPIEDRDKFYVVLRYVKLKNPQKDRVTRSVGYPYYKTWLAPQQDPDGAIIGVGANLSYDYAEECFNKFEQAVQLPPYEIQKIERGTTPYRRPPYSLVADRFVVMGDSACITKPYSGEGITASWILCDIAADVIGKVIKTRL